MVPELLLLQSPGNWALPHLRIHTQFPWSSSRIFDDQDVQVCVQGLGVYQMVHAQLYIMHGEYWWHLAFLDPFR